MSNFWSMVNEELYKRGSKSLFERINEDFPTISDEDYEGIYATLTEQATNGDLRNLTKDEAYFLLADKKDFTRISELALA